MLSLLLLVPLALTPQQAQQRGSGGSAQRPQPITSITQTGHTPAPGTLLSGSSAATPFTPTVTVTPVGAGTMFPGIKGQSALWKIVLQDPAGTGWNEPFLLQVPPAIAFPAPMLVAHHAYGVSMNDIKVNTTYADECAQRGWFLLAPLGANDLSFACEEFQANTAFVLDLVSSLWPTGVDASRIYGVGFSMGGGNALNYAARHLDPERPMFAAIANHTGTVAQINQYNQDPAVQWIYEFWHGAGPLSVPFAYQRSSLVNYDQASKVVLTGSDVARNLTHVPVRNTYATFDPLKHLIDQTKVFHGQLVARGGDSTLVALSGVGHSWSTLNETITCDWLAQHTLALPTSAETLADRDGRWFHFDVAQDAPGAFTPFTWDGDAGANRLTVSATANLARLTADVESLGLDAGVALEVVTSTSDGAPDEIGVTGYASPPTSVLRDGVPTASWTWSGVDDTVVLLEFDGSVAHTWQIAP